METKILSWNIWCDCYFDKVTEFITSSNPDIIALQEVTFDDPERDIVSFLKDKGYQYASAPGAEFTDSKNRHHKLNNLIFSRFPIVESKAHLLRAEGKVATVEAKIDIHGKIFSAFSVHLKHTHFERTDLQDEQARTLVNIIPTSQGIVMGDFNALPESYPVQLMLEKYRNTDPNCAPTWCMYRDGCPVCQLEEITKRLDYIFVSPDVATSKPEVGMSKGSDHLPILVTINV